MATHDTNIGNRLSEIERRLDAIERAINETNARNQEIDRALLSSGFHDIRAMVDAFRTLTIVVLGSDDLHIKPLRPMVERLDLAYVRAKWVAGTLATSNIGTLAAWISTLLQ